MQNNPQSRPGFIPVEEAIALIKKDRRDDAVVDLQFLVNNLPYLRAKHVYNIRLLKTIIDEKTKIPKVVRNGSVYVSLANDYDVQILARAITEAFQERTNIQVNFDEPGVNKITTAIDEEKNIVDPTLRVANPALRNNTESKTQVGTDISQPYEQVLNGV